MSQSTSPTTGKIYGLQRVCKAWKVSRSGIYAKKQIKSRGDLPLRKGPKPKISDEDILEAVMKDLEESPFKGEGHRKVHARIRKKVKEIGKSRILRIMRENKLLSPHRQPRGDEQTHDGKITTDEPNKMWGTDAIRIETVDEGIIWGFFAIEHWNAECMGWHVCKQGNAQAALEPIKQGIKKIYDSIEQGAAKGLTMREDHGAQYTAEQYRSQLRFWGIKISYGFVQEPETNGVIERFNRTLKEQVVHGRIFRNLEEVRACIGKFVESYNQHWLLGKLGYRSPVEARAQFNKLNGAA